MSAAEPKTRVFASHRRGGEGKTACCAVLLTVTRISSAVLLSW